MNFNEPLRNRSNLFIKNALIEVYLLFYSTNDKMRAQMIKVIPDRKAQAKRSLNLESFLCCISTQQSWLEMTKTKAPLGSSSWTLPSRL